MPQAHIYQIFYNDETRADLDPGFIPLDNSANERPDWREYWPIRRYLMQHALEDDRYYGFFSPKFRQKTQLTSEVVKQFIEADRTDADVFMFSPYVEQGAVFFNVFEQGNWWHPGLLEVAQHCLKAAQIDCDLRSLVTHSGNTVFCNYFVAKPRFWRAWLEINECLFSLLQGEGGHSLRDALNAITAHDGRADAPMKVFVMERTATLMLAMSDRFRPRSYNPFQLPLANPSMLKYKRELLMCDALKVAFATHGISDHRDAFFRLRCENLRRFGLKKRVGALIAH